ncbi:MAG TPA: hypothetical protein VLE27_06270 [Thermoanaerobaculia bacterium]|nr:hypothetical protein [Thermoanaerobaculia bacterium]
MGVSLLIAFKMVPIKIQSTELYDYMDELAKFSAARTPPPELEKMIMDRAEQLDIPLEKRNIEVKRNGDRIFMQIEYTIPVEFPGYTYQWHFRQKLDRTIFIV